MSAKVVRATRPADLAALRDGVIEVFELVQTAIAQGRQVVIVVNAEDLLGHGGPELGAYVGALIGIARAVAFEGARPGWSCNVLAVPPERVLTDDEVVSLMPPEVTGQVITLGAGLVGKVSP